MSRRIRGGGDVGAGPVPGPADGHAVIHRWLRGSHGAAGPDVHVDTEGRWLDVGYVHVDTEGRWLDVGYVCSDWLPDPDAAQRQATTRLAVLLADQPEWVTDPDDVDLTVKRVDGLWQYRIRATRPYTDDDYTEDDDG